jgi:hypothetical protein
VARSLHGMCCITQAASRYSSFIVVFIRGDGHICPPAVVLAEVPEPSVPTRNLNLVWANSHGLERKNYVRIWVRVSARLPSGDSQIAGRPYASLRWVSS